MLLPISTTPGSRLGYNITQRASKHGTVETLPMTRSLFVYLQGATLVPDNPDYYDNCILMSFSSKFALFWRWLLVWTERACLILDNRHKKHIEQCTALLICSLNHKFHPGRTTTSARAIELGWNFNYMERKKGAHRRHHEPIFYNSKTISHVPPRPLCKLIRLKIASAQESKQSVIQKRVGICLPTNRYSWRVSLTNRTTQVEPIWFHCQCVYAELHYRHKTFNLTLLEIRLPANGPHLTDTLHPTKSRNLQQLL